MKMGTGSAISCIRAQLRPLLLAVPVPFFISPGLWRFLHRERRGRRRRCAPAIALRGYVQSWCGDRRPARLERRLGNRGERARRYGLGRRHSGLNGDGHGRKHGTGPKVPSAAWATPCQHRTALVVRGGTHRATNHGHRKSCYSPTKENKGTRHSVSSPIRPRLTSQSADFSHSLQSSTLRHSRQDCDGIFG